MENFCQNHPGADDYHLWKNCRKDSVINIRNIAFGSIALIWFAVSIRAIVLAQERLVFRVTAENTEYTKQHTIDVGDVPGHQVRLFEIKRRYPTQCARE